MTSRRSDRLGPDRVERGGPPQPLAGPAANNEDEYDHGGAAADTTGHGLRPRSTDPRTGPGPDTGPRAADAGPDPDRDTAGRSGADTGAGSHARTGMAQADLDPATGGLGEMRQAGSASPSRSRTRTAVYGTDTEPFAGGAARGKQE